MPSKRTTNHLQTEHHQPAKQLAPLALGVYAVTCPVCLSAPGEWCTAIYTLPTGTLLSRAHDDRHTEAGTHSP